jgi:hypothetical protein
MGYDAAHGRDFLQTFRYNLSVPSSRVRKPRSLPHEDGDDGLSRNVGYHYTLRNSPEEYGYHPIRGGSVKSNSKFFSCGYNFPYFVELAVV